MTGAGNDFILFDRKENPEIRITPDFASKICSRRFGIGADGILVISDSGRYDFDLEYYNADGSNGSLCGNGARCAIKYAESSGRMKNAGAEFMLNNKVYSGNLLNNGGIKFNFNDPGKLVTNLNVQGAGQLIKASFVDTGAKHLIININDILEHPGNAASFYRELDELPVKEIGKEIRYSDAFAPEGVNINFISISNGKVKIRTYEKGVEDETLACGTGCCAAAISISSINNIKPPINLHTRGGVVLAVDFTETEENITGLSLIGPAEIIFKGEITI